MEIFGINSQRFLLLLLGVMQGKATFKNGFIGMKGYDCSTELSKLRENKQDDSQAITSVHEAGHAVLSIILLNRIPELIRSRTAGVNTGGFVSGNLFDGTIVKTDVIKRMAILLGGMTAEQFIFGESMLTGGSSSDIRKATTFGLEIAKTCGFSSIPTYYTFAEPSTNYYFHQAEEQIESEVAKWIIEAKRLALATLQNNESFLLSVGDSLFDKSIMTREELELHTRKFFPDFIEKQLISNGSKGDYVRILQKRAKELKAEQKEISCFSSDSADLVAYGE